MINLLFPKSGNKLEIHNHFPINAFVMNEISFFIICLHYSYMVKSESGLVINTALHVSVVSSTL